MYIQPLHRTLELRFLFWGSSKSSNFMLREYILCHLNLKIHSFKNIIFYAVERPRLVKTVATRLR